MTVNDKQLQEWLSAAQVAFTMGSRHTDKGLALILAIHKDVSTNKPDQVADFLDDLASEMRMYDLIRRRFKPELYTDFAVGVDVQIYIAYMAHSPGEAVMAMTYLHLNKCKNIKDMVKRLLPNGYPADDAMGLLWNLQKIQKERGSLAPDNMVDYPNTVNSLYNSIHNSGAK